MKQAVHALSLFLVLVLGGRGGAQAQSYGPMRTDKTPAVGLPATLRDVGIEQRLDAQLPLDAVLMDEERRSVTLGQYFNTRPVVLAFVYYDCPMLCTQVLNGLVGSLRALQFDAGKEFEVVALSFDATERNKPGLAAGKKAALLEQYRRDTAPQGVHFLTGDDANIKRVTDAAGFKFKWDNLTKQFAHASGIMVATPAGRLSRYFYGIEYAPRDLRLGLIEAAAGKIGTPTDALLLYCFHYDPLTGRYSAVVMNILRLAGIVFLLCALLFYLSIWWHRQRQKRLARNMARHAARRAARQTARQTGNVAQPPPPGVNETGGVLR